jgi:gamma-glutamyltranspeptidase / glutathione hydrolase
MPTRPTILASEAVAATGHPLASTAAFEVLRRGGNAVDAAVAAAGVLAVVQPEMCGVGGDAFLLIYLRGAGTVLALNGSGAAPRGLDQSGGVPATGPGSATVPGAVAAWADAVARCGTRDLAELLRPAIGLAEDGFPVSAPVARAFAENAVLLAAHPETRSAYLPLGRPPRFGERLALPHLARTLRSIAGNGAEPFYHGDLGQRIAEGVRSAGGVLTGDDLAAHASEWAEPIRGRYRGREVFVQPPISQGIVALGELALFTDDDPAALGIGSVDYIHLMVEICRLAFADRDRYLGDHRWIDVDLGPFLDAARAAERRRTIDPSRARSSVSPTRPGRSGGTSYLCVIDRDGNAVSLIQSIFADFGSGIVAGDTGVLLNNRVGGFSTDPASPNAAAPGKRPLHTLNNCLVMRRGEGSRDLEYVLGTPGTDAQVQTLFQLLVPLLDFELGVQEAIELPRWRSEADGSLLVESRFEPRILDELAACGHELVRGGPWEPRTGGAQAIYVSRPEGILHGGADPRREGYAIGW